MADASGGLGSRLGKRFPLRHLRRDLPAGVVLGVESVPDGLAAGLLASGSTPSTASTGYLFGTLFGAVATSSAFMAVQATGAMAVVVSDVEQVRGDSPEAVTALFTLSVMAGVVMLALGLARMGWIVRLVLNAVLTGFINAVAVNIVLGQLDNLTGYTAEGQNRVARAVDTALNAPEFVWPAVLVGTVTIALIVALERTRLGALGMVVAIVAGTVQLVVGVTRIRWPSCVTSLRCRVGCRSRSCRAWPWSGRC